MLLDVCFSRSNSTSTYLILCRIYHEALENVEPRSQYVSSDPDQNLTSEVEEAFSDYLHNYREHQEDMDEKRIQERAKELGACKINGKSSKPRIWQTCWRYERKRKGRIYGKSSNMHRFISWICWSKGEFCLGVLV